MKFKGVFTWNREDQTRATDNGFNYPALTVHQKDRKRLWNIFLKLDKWQKKALEKLKEKYADPSPEQFQSCIRNLDVTIEVHYKKRTLPMNSLMWALYTIEANEMNGGQQGAREQMVQPMQLYEDDLREFGKRILIGIERSDFPVFQNEYRIIEAVILNNGAEMSTECFLKWQMQDSERITLRAIKGSSKFNTVEMAQWIDRIFNRIAYHGINVTQPEEISRYWEEWRQGLNDKKIILHDSVMTQEEYKILNPICEASGEFIGHGGGELAHIKGFGMGGDRSAEPYRNYSSNWLHLKAEIHREIWHGQGVKAFLKAYPHLRYKVELALHREYPKIENIEEVQ